MPITQHTLIVVKDGIDYSAHGPFNTVHEAQVFARDFREHHDIPGHDNVEPTPEENEAWTEDGWYFGIHYLEAPFLAPDPSEPGVPGNDDDRYQED